jgi:Spy/CpxP family protein refolding chaperone
MKQILAAIALMAVLVLLARAQSTVPAASATSQTVANRVAGLTQLLNLNASQQESASTIFSTEQTALATPRISMQSARVALQAAIKSNDTAKISTLATQIGALTSQEVLAQATASAAFYAILTALQQSKYDTHGPLGVAPGGTGSRLGGSH